MTFADPTLDPRPSGDLIKEGTDASFMKDVIEASKTQPVIVDFWATWCGPCRTQYPLYQQVKRRFQDNPDVVFLAINTDEDRDVVAPFLQAQKWEKNVYFDEGLGALLKVNSIPTTMIMGRSGAIVSRLNGYIADRFVGMLSQRIEEALAEK